ncbi:MAG: family 43 glycosylhydrolase [Bacteroidaceae bacterium]|nr:family 43 glycosylhydrolase [Bacteroidaceae bacterium]
MLKTTIHTLILITLLLTCNKLHAWEGMEMPRLKVDGKHLKDENGNIVKLHGYAQTFSPWFNEQGRRWNNYDVEGCLGYNKRIIDGIMSAGWKMSFVRMHMDPYWSNIPGRRVKGENDISAFDFNRFTKYLDEVFIPMAEYAISKGLYVVMRPPGVCPEKIAVGDYYQKYLIKVWRHVAQHHKLKNHPNIMFELANEPINIVGSDGTVGGNAKAHFEQLSIYFQEITDSMRAQGCNNILWIPGLGYQSKYAGYADYPIKGENIGYAVHIYPGWFGSSHNYEAFSRGWQADVQPVADFAPVMITEMDWADKKYNASWGKAHTGVAGDGNFGANFKKITDDAGNVSWLLFTSPEHLAAFKDEPAKDGNYTFLNDPEACPWPIYHWYKEYAKSHYPRKAFTRTSTADCDAHRFANPVIFGDFPDPDVIRVGDTYYMISTTMHIFPGATILQSKDLVHWEYCYNPLESIEKSEAYNLENGKQRYGHGQWATALQYNKGIYYILFTTLDEGSYLLTSDNIKGPWNKRKLATGYYDCGVLFDGDDIYVAHGIDNIRIAKVDKHFNKIEERVVAKQSVKPGLEGSRLYKIGDYYYIYATYGGVPAYQTIFRSKNIFGPYEEKFLLDDRNIHQGALINTEGGEWWTMLFADRGAYGRMPYLLPVEWKDGWPAIQVNSDKSEIYRKPSLKEYRNNGLVTNDNFRHYDMGLQWGWNHNSDNSRWSLTERPGYLRLYTASVTDNLYSARNTLTQRILGYHHSDGLTYGTIAMDISKMKDGDIAGLAVMQDPSAFIAVKQVGRKRYIMHSTLSLRKNDKTESMGERIKATTLYLRIVTDYSSSKARFYYSTDNTTYKEFGAEFTMRYDLSVFTGNKFAIFNYATKGLGGHIDVDWFSTEPRFEEGIFYDDHFEGYSEESLSVEKIEFAKGNATTLLTGSARAIELTATYKDGHTADISSLATYSDYDKEIISLSNGRLTALKDGKTQVTAKYKGARGEQQSATMEITATTFPLLQGEFNPSIWERGTFDEKSRTVTTGKYGFAGWRYDNGIDLTRYKYLVVEISGGEGAALSFRLFDENNYWSDCATFDFNDKKRLVISTEQIARNRDKSKRFAAEHVHIIGFWTTGGVPFTIENIYLCNEAE